MCTHNQSNLLLCFRPSLCLQIREVSKPCFPVCCLELRPPLIQAIAVPVARFLGWPKETVILLITPVIVISFLLHGVIKKF